MLSAVMDVEAMTAVSGSSFSLSSVVDAEIIHGATTVVATMVAVATIAAANKRNFEDGLRAVLFVFYKWILSS